MADRQEIDAAQWSDLGRLLPAVGQTWRRVLGQRIAEEGLSDATALPILELLRAGDRLMRQRELAERLGLEGSGIVWVLDSLEKKGLVIRREDPSDRRAKLLELTPAGRRMGARVDRVALTLRRELLDGVAPGDVAAAYRMLTGLAAALGRCEAEGRRR